MTKDEALLSTQLTREELINKIFDHFQSQMKQNNKLVSMMNEEMIRLRMELENVPPTNKEK